jgi:hypothetical protein
VAHQSGVVGNQSQRHPVRVFLPVIDFHGGFFARSADSRFSTSLRPAGADPTLRSGLLAERHPGESSTKGNAAESKIDLCATVFPASLWIAAPDDFHREGKYTIPPG